MGRMLISRVGETRMMNCGMEAEIIAYRAYADIDVRMSDGRIVRGCQYDAFKRGSINGLGIRTVSIRTSKKRIGEKRVMNNGLEAEIIAYRSYEDVDIRFADGTIREHCRIDNFLSGSIGKVYAEERLGEKRIMNCGLEAEIIAYRNALDMDVRMSDGRIVRGCTYDVFKRGAISGLGTGSNRVMILKNNQLKRIGETRMMNCGMEAEIIAYRGCEDIDVRLSDGSIYEHKQYWTFSNGKIGPHHRSAAKNKITKASAKVGKNERWTKMGKMLMSRVGEKRMMNCGLEAEIVAYRAYADIDVRMSDGRIVKGCRYGDFKRSAISGLGAGPDKVIALKNNQAKRIGETRMMNCGLEAEIIAYRACSDIDVRLSDGSIYEHKQYWAFSNGKIGPYHRRTTKK